MADNSWEPLVQISERLFPNLNPQIVPAAHPAKMVLQAIQTSLKNKEIDIPKQIHCKWCGRVVNLDSKPPKKAEKVSPKRTNTGMNQTQELIIQPQRIIPAAQHARTIAVERVLVWDLDWSKKVLKIKGAQICCQECHLLLDLKKLLNFLLMLDGSTDRTKLYSLASHFCQINGQTSQSGEADVKLLQQAVSITHSLHVLTKIIPDITIQGLSGESVTLESVDEVVESVCRQLPGSVQKYTPKVKRRKKKEATLTVDAELTPESSSLSVKKSKSTSEKKKKKQVLDSLTNGHCDGGHDEFQETSDEPTKKRLFASLTEDAELTPESSSLSVKKSKSTSKKKKKKKVPDSLTNGRCDGDHDEFQETSDEPTRKRPLLSEKRKIRTDEKARAHGKKKRSLPVMKLD